MFGIIIIAIIVYAVIQHRKRNRLRWKKWGDVEWQKWAGDEWAKWGGDSWKCKTSQAERYARDFESKMSKKFDASAEKFERKMRQRFDKQTRKYGGVSADPAQDHTEPQFKSDAERQAYNRARRRAAAEAGFYVHMMWYGVIIGFLFIINLVTGGFSSYPWFLWPALFWGFGVASHFSAVYGWRWVHDRVFEPAIQREVQREVTKEKEHLRTEKQASLDELTATFAHEIRNPIAAAKSLVQQMGEDPTSHENVEYAKVALDELARVERSVSHLLKYAKEEDYNFENVNLSSVLDGALTQMRSKLEANSIVVSRAYLSGPTVRADADKLRQVFSNIIDNAIDAMESTTGERKLEFAIQNNGAGMAAVRIRDNGCGIAEDKIAKIFNPFYTSKTNGTGLGLGVAKKVIDAHRGMIQVQSKVGNGTEFILAIPLSDAMRDAVAPASESPNELPQTSSNSRVETPIQAAPSPIMTAPISSPAAETSRLRN